jgi:general secretion pathway protein K
MLGTAQQYLDVKTQPVTRVDLAVSLADGFSESAQAVIVVRREDQEPYRVLVWNPSSRPHE